MPHFAHFPALVEVDQINRKLHKKRVNRFARRNPQPLARPQQFVPEQANAPLGAGIGYIDGLTQNSIPGLISH